jgi:hypothetical protein
MYANFVMREDVTPGDETLPNVSMFARTRTFSVFSKRLTIIQMRVSLKSTDRLRQAIDKERPPGLFSRATLFAELLKSRIGAQRIPDWIQP